MTTAAELRSAIKTYARRATETEQEPNNRVRCFVARLSGSMAGIGDPELEQTLWALLGHPDAATTQPESPPCAS